jgi:hypothetical protein
LELQNYSITKSKEELSRQKIAGSFEEQKESGYHEGSGISKENL